MYSCRIHDCFSIHFCQYCIHRLNSQETAAEIKYELSVQLQYEQYYAEIEGKLPIIEQIIFPISYILDGLRSTMLSDHKSTSDGKKVN